MAAAAEDKKIIAVFGATGAQGGNVLKGLQASKTPWAIRALTRNPDSDKSKLLKEQGCEVVKVEASDKDSLAAALKGVYGAFVVTQFWEKMDGNLELEQGKNIAEACAAAGVQHVVFSSLEDTREANAAGELASDTLEPLQDKDGNKWIIPHFDAKGAIQKIMEDMKLPATFVLYSMYLDNFMSLMKPQKQEDGSRVIALPMSDKPTGVISVEDAGPAVAAIFENRDEYLGKSVGLANENVSMDKVAEAFSEATGDKFVYAPVPMETFAAFGFPGAEELARMFGALYCADQKYCVRDPEATRKLNPALRTIKEWAAAHKDELLA